MPVASVPSALAGRPDYPGRVIKRDEDKSAVVKLIQQRLNEVGCGPLKVTGIFDRHETEAAVKLFQARFPDATGRPLIVDGKVGSLTWGALFGATTVPSSAKSRSKLLTAVLQIAAAEVGVMEKPLGSNRGPRVDQYLKAVGLTPSSGSFPWCVAFTYFCFQEAAQSLGIKNPHVRTAGVLAHWNAAKSVRGAERITHVAATNDPSLVKPGQLFVMDYGGGAGHTGLILAVANGRLTTIEGNTNDGGSRNGIGVFQRDARKIAGINRGFIDYSQFR